MAEFNIDPMYGVGCPAEGGKSCPTENVVRAIARILPQDASLIALSHQLQNNNLGRQVIDSVSPDEVINQTGEALAKCLKCKAGFMSMTMTLGQGGGESMNDPSIGENPNY